MTPLPRRLTPGPRPAGEVTASAGELSVDRWVAVTELFNVHYAPLVRMARFLVDDEETAEDVVMDAFTSLYRRWSAIRDPHEAYRYVRSCVLNGARSRLRRRRLTRLHEGVLLAEPSTGEDLGARGADRMVVMQVMRTLPVRQRQVLVLRYFLDLTEAEIAHELRINTGSVKTHASRGIAALAPALEDCR